jgi:hypothetical protein
MIPSLEAVRELHLRLAKISILEGICPALVRCNGIVILRGGCRLGGPNTGKKAAVGMKTAYKVQTISIETATYGGNCGAARGNDTDHLGTGCNGKDECKYAVDFALIGDPAPGCVKDYEVVYACSGSKTKKPCK